MLPLARTLILAGLVLLIVGFSIYVIARTGLPVGRLPGDLRFERGNFTCLFSLATSVFLSIFLTILLNVLVRLIRK